MPIILDGKLQHSIIREIGKDDDFVINLLKNKDLSVKNVFYAFYKNKQLFIIKYDDLN